MKKIRLIILLILIFVLCLFVAPSVLNAQPILYNGHYYDLIAPFNGSWTDARDDANTKTFQPLPNSPIYYGHLVTITSQDEASFIETLIKANEDFYWIGAFQTGSDEPAGGWQWVTGEAWQFTDWSANEPSNNGGFENYAEYNSEANSWNDTILNDESEDGYLIEYEIRPAVAPYVEPVWVRDTQMKCKVVWINQDNMFQFSFIYPYADNNWVRIYDMAGNMVYEVDMPYDNPNIIVDLPNGMYTVKTFNDQPEPIQTFVIGK